MSVNLKCLETLGSTIAGQNVSVEIGRATRVYLYEKQFVIQLRLSPEMDDRDLALVDGFIDHEAAHVRYTDFHAGEKSDARLKRMTNLVEDIRIELLIGRHYPGAAINLNRTATILCQDESFWAFPKPDDGLLSLVSRFALYVGRSAFLNQPALATRAKRSAEILLSRVGSGRFNQVKQVVQSFGRLTSTVDAIATAKKLLDLIDDIKASGEDNIPPQKPEDEKSSNGEQSSGEQSSGEQSSNGEQSSGEKSSGEKSSGEKSSGEKSSNGEQSSNGGQSSSNQDEGAEAIVNGMGDLDKVIDAIAETLNVEFAKNNPGVFNVLENIVPIQRHPVTMPGELVSSLARADVTQSCAVAFKRWARDMTYSSRTYRSKGNNIDQSRLWMVNASQSRVFKVDSRGIAPSAAVLVLLDSSGSMDRATSKSRNAPTRFESASAAAASIKESLSGKGFACSVLAYNTGVKMVCDWDSNSFTLPIASGGTSVNVAIATGIPHLLKRKEEKKVIMLMTDGSFDSDFMPKAVEEMTSHGIDFCAVRFADAHRKISGLSDELNPFVQDMSDLPDVMSKLICECLKPNA